VVVFKEDLKINQEDFFILPKLLIMVTTCPIHINTSINGNISGLLHLKPKMGKLV